MREQVTITPFGSPDNIDHVYFKEALKTSLGRNVERAISGIEAAIEEMELCVEYSDTSESLK